MGPLVGPPRRSLVETARPRGRQADALFFGKKKLNCLATNFFTHFCSVVVVVVVFVVVVVVVVSGVTPV